ncbi:hypothetical protein GCM10008955_40560 [Deinococcus malanensis]|uniref:Uncharacterized protein n=1 Tax=Deinococcus malanensis TaxID=1706855 RepID=A0ABQ2F283_9DEIO|nr:hypothetical protein [Deinococcus malanensis]GGK42698.1 hypothetical protein GCM10008955_40560 [Deinococcus malanensis]
MRALIRLAALLTFILSFTLSACGQTSAVESAPTIETQRQSAGSVTLATSDVTVRLKDSITVPVTITMPRNTKGPVTLRFDALSEPSGATLSAPTVDAPRGGSVTVPVTITGERTLIGVSAYRVTALAGTTVIGSADLSVNVTHVNVTFTFEPGEVSAPGSSTVNLIVVVNADSHKILPFTVQPVMRFSSDYGDLTNPGATYTVTELPARIPVSFTFSDSSTLSVNAIKFDVMFGGLQALGATYQPRYLNANFIWNVQR